MAKLSRRNSFTKGQLLRCVAHSEELAAPSILDGATFMYRNLNAYNNACVYSYRFVVTLYFFVIPLPAKCICYRYPYCRPAGRGKKANLNFSDGCSIFDQYEGSCSRQSTNRFYDTQRKIATTLLS